MSIEVSSEVLLKNQEVFVIEFDHFSHNGADIVWFWESTKIRFRIEVDTDAENMTESRKQIAENPTAATYYQSARYLQEKGKIRKMYFLSCLSIK